MKKRRCQSMPVNTQMRQERQLHGCSVSSCSSFGLGPRPAQRRKQSTEGVGRGNKVPSRGTSLLAGYDIISYLRHEVNNCAHERPTDRVECKVCYVGKCDVDAKHKTKSASYMQARGTAPNTATGHPPPPSPPRIFMTRSIETGLSHTAKGHSQELVALCYS